MNRMTVQNVGFISAIMVALVSLAGCTSPKSEVSEENGIPVPGGFVYEDIEPPSPVIYRDIETGKVTKLVDKEGRVVFNANYEDDDVRFSLYEQREVSPSLDTVVALNGADYPIKMYYTLRTKNNLSELIDFYNAHVAQPVALSTDVVPGETPTMSLVEKVSDYVESQYLNGMASGVYPSPQFGVDGNVVIKQNMVVADAYRRGDLSAWTPDPDALRPPGQAPDYPEESGSHQSNSRPLAEPFFDFDCATYDVKLQNGADVITALADVEGTKYFEILLSDQVISMTAQTPEPCRVMMSHDSNGETNP